MMIRLYMKMTSACRDDDLHNIKYLLKKGFILKFKFLSPPNIIIHWNATFKCEPCIITRRSLDFESSRLINEDGTFNVLDQERL